jgi:hypothetical protein
MQQHQQQLASPSAAHGPAHFAQQQQQQQGQDPRRWHFAAPPEPGPSPARALSQPPAPAPAPPPNLLDADDADIVSADAPPTPGAKSAPARPPNPELLALHARVHAQLSAELASLTHALEVDGARLRAQQADLLAGAPALADELGRLDAVRGVCGAVAGRLGAAVGAAERAVGELRRKGEPGVDELVCSTSIVHNQCVRFTSCCFLVLCFLVWLGSWMGGGAGWVWARDGVDGFWGAIASLGRLGPGRRLPCLALAFAFRRSR